MLAGILFVLRTTLQGLGEKIMPLLSSVIELVLKTIFVMMVIPKLGYYGVIISEPVIWMIMTVQLAIAFRKNTYMFKQKEETR